MVVDDEPRARLPLAEILRMEGYEVSAAASGEEALELIANEPPFDLMVLDLKMPGMDGLQLTQAVQQVSPDTVIVLLTAFGTLETAIEAMRRGAHDYLLKPCPVPQILESIRRGLAKQNQERHRRDLVDRLEQTLAELAAVERGEERRMLITATSPARFLRLQDVEMDREHYLVTVAGRPVALTPTEFRLLSVLMENADRIISPQELVRHTQGYECDPWGARAIVRVHIRRLRRKLEPDSLSPRYIVNVRGVGYTFPSVPPPADSTAAED